MPIKSRFDAPQARFEVERMAFVALGSNLEDSRAHVLAAMNRLQDLTDLPILRSSLWNSTPVDCPPGSPMFVNAVAGLVPRRDETPESLLARLQAIEREFGRQPKQIPNEPRPLDLDLVSFRQEVRATSELTLPHPRADGRRFVLQPLSEIAPDLVLPGGILNVKQLIETLETDERLSRLP